MTEGEAQAWIAERFGQPAVARVSRFLDMVVAENERQNLIAPSTVGSIWVRHALDSAQLIQWDKPGPWLDIGSGGGFPGMVVALLRSDQVILSEPRRRRAEFLSHAVRDLALTNVKVEAHAVEALGGVRANVISARALASIEKILRAAAHCATPQTRWILPRGRVTPEALDELPALWKSAFHVEQSLTHPESAVVILDGAP